MQGVGILTASLVAIATTAAFKSLILKDISYLDYVWRIELGLGVVPALLTVYLRNKLPEPPQWTLVRICGRDREGERGKREREREEDCFFRPSRAFFFFVADAAFAAASDFLSHFLNRKKTNGKRTQKKCRTRRSAP